MTNELKYSKTINYTGHVKIVVDNEDTRYEDELSPEDYECLTSTFAKDTYRPTVDEIIESFDHRISAETAQNIEGILKTYIYVKEDEEQD